ncbi:collagen alpha-1(I) chain-like [Trachypithecus francoisi]|uniref:collagen alpha-1(I) chain-like n=1 Tax=Trachypithecus francoisi TaxID=54180 RepID=UPI00141AD8CC|nr:collagen alpha-1(I) chain-like [Trachypithecus francoisi]
MRVSSVCIWDEERRRETRGKEGARPGCKTKRDPGRRRLGNQGGSGGIPGESGGAAREKGGPAAWKVDPRAGRSSPPERGSRSQREEGAVRREPEAAGLRLAGGREQAPGAAAGPGGGGGAPTWTCWPAAVSPGGDSSPAEAATASAPGARGCGGSGRGDGGKSLWRPPPPNGIPPRRPALLPYLPLLNFFPGINKPAARGGHLRRSRPRAAPTPPAAGPSGLRLPSYDSCPSPSPRGRVRAAAAALGLLRALAPSSSAGHFRAGPDLPPRSGSHRRLALRSGLGRLRSRHRSG